MLLLVFPDRDADHAEKSDAQAHRGDEAGHRHDRDRRARGDQQAR